MSSLAESSAPAATARAAGHPWRLYVLFATEMWERFGFYTIAGVMTLYLQRGGFGWTEKQATTLWSNYLMFVYATPLIGGWLADKALGYRLSVLVGGIVFVAGYALLTTAAVSTFYLALVLLFIGNGFFKPNISTMVGTLYPAGSPLRDSAYNIFYMGINIGAFLAPVAAEVIIQQFVSPEAYGRARDGKPLTETEAVALQTGFRWAFAAAAVGMTLGIAIFSAFYRKLAVADRRRAPEADPAGPVVDLPPAREKSALEQVPEWKRVGALLVIFGIVIVFWMSFHQNGSTMTYWADQNTDWESSRATRVLIQIFTLGLIDGSNVSGVISNAINPFWIIVLSLPLVAFWRWLNKRGLEPSTPTKMAIGMTLTCVAFLILYAAAATGGDQEFLTDSQGNYLLDAKGEYQVARHPVSPWWLIAAYGVLSLGELMLSPMGLSLVSKVAPERMRGMLMGGWFVATAIGNKLTKIGILYSQWYYSQFWLLVASLALAMAVVLFLLIRPLKRAMPGV